MKIYTSFLLQFVNQLVSPQRTLIYCQNQISGYNGGAIVNRNMLMISQVIEAKGKRLANIDSLMNNSFTTNDPKHIKMIDRHSSTQNRSTVADQHLASTVRKLEHFTAQESKS